MLKGKRIAEDIFYGALLTNEEIDFTEKRLVKMEVKKGQFIFKTNAIVDFMYYVQSGCLRTYHTDVYGKEQTVQFAIKDWWITDFTAFFSSSKAVMSLEVLKNATIYKLSSAHRIELIEHIPEIRKLIRQKLENAYAAFQKRILSNLSLSAKEQYIDFVNSHPNIESQVKNYHIASYLGITTESLSRIRKEI